MRPSAGVPLLPVCFLLALASACDADDAATERCIEIDPDVVLRAALPDREVQGVNMQGSQLQERELQGHELQDREQQGTEQQDREMQGESWQGTALTITHLMGMQLELADGSDIVTMTNGTLVGDGRVGAAALRDVELVGTSRSGETFTVRITAVETIEGSERISIVAGGAQVCGDGLAGMFVPGSWDDTGAHAIEGDELTYACMDGVIAKCVSWGYAPWQVGTELHQTCTRLARADYCGDGHPWTMNGTLIDVYDTRGIQSPVHDPDLSFEAAWGEDGAICVNATRYDITGTDGETILPACLATLPRCTSFAEATALGAEIVNESAHTPIDACG
jgi:hypothetical protein